MKKIVVLALFIAIFVFSGCTKEQTQKQDNTVNKDDFAMRRPDFGQPEREVDIRGLVKSIVGNEIIILKIDPSTRFASFDKLKTGSSGQDGEQEGEENDKDQKSGSLGIGMTGGGRMPGMGRGSRPGSGEVDAGMQTEMLERMKEMSTGEETILIPIGIQMLKPGDNDPSASSGQVEKIEMVEATFEDISENKMIQVWLNQDITDRKVAEFVLITR